jgi:hypothetical protein
MGLDSGPLSGKVRPPTILSLETNMRFNACGADKRTAIRTDLGAIFVSLELSRPTWLITSLSPGAGEQMSKHAVRSGDIAGLLVRFAEIKEKARRRTGKHFGITVIQEAGLDGFWIHRVLEKEGIASHVVDPAAIMTARRRRRAKTDRIDGEAPGAGADGLSSRRAAGVCDAAGAEAGGGRAPSGIARAEEIDR